MPLRAMQRLGSMTPLGVVTKAAFPIAIDFGASSMKVLQIAPGDPPSLVAAGCVETPDDVREDIGKRLAFQLGALSKLLRGIGFRGRRAVCAIPAEQTYCKALEFARGEGSLTQLVASTMAAQLERDASSMVFRHFEVGESGKGGKTEVLCLAAGRDLVERMMVGLKGAKLDVVGVHCEFPAMLRAFDYLNRRGTDDTMDTLVLDLGAETTKAVIARGMDMVFARCIPFGGRTLDEALDRQTGCGQSRARERRLAAEDLAGGSASGGEVRRGVNLSETLEILTDEVQMGLRYHEGAFPGRRVGRAIFVGGEARHMGLCRHIARTLKLPAQVADPLARVARTGKEDVIGVDLSHPQPGWALAVGMSLCPTDL